MPYEPSSGRSGARTRRTPSQKAYVGHIRQSTWFLSRVRDEPQLEPGGCTDYLGLAAWALSAHVVRGPQRRRDLLTAERDRIERARRLDRQPTAGPVRLSNERGTLSRTKGLGEDDQHYRTSGRSSPTPRKNESRNLALARRPRRELFVARFDPLATSLRERAWMAGKF
jgi:hypothetical protein